LRVFGKIGTCPKLAMEAVGSLAMEVCGER
jgi:hypothetical protein